MADSPNMNRLWAAFCNEARSDPDLLYERADPTLHGIHEAPADDDRTLDNERAQLFIGDDTLLPRACSRPESDGDEDCTPPVESDAAGNPEIIESMSEYIKQLEELIANGPNAGAETWKRQQRDGSIVLGPSSASTVNLRHDNRLLRAKNLMLQRQLDEAHARARRAEKVNAQWRGQHGALQRREREGWERLQHAMRRIERAEQTQRHNAQLREALEQRRRELVACSRRCSDAEAKVNQLKDALAKAMGHLRPEALDALS